MPNWKEADTSYINAYYDIDFREHPELYRIGKGEQGVLVAQPAKNEVVAIGWRFKTPELAEESSTKILAYFYERLEASDFPCADLARKWLQMGFTRARRYANHSTGRKYDVNMNVLPQEADALTSEKAQSAEIFRVRYVEARDNKKYKSMMAEHKEKYE